MDKLTRQVGCTPDLAPVEETPNSDFVFSAQNLRIQVVTQDTARFGKADFGSHSGTPPTTHKHRMSVLNSDVQPRKNVSVQEALARLHRPPEVTMHQFDRTNDVRLLQGIGRSIAARHQELKASPIVGFLARIGVEYAGELMWVGRALNGADNAGYTPDQLAQDASQKFAEEALIAAESGKPCPMGWVTQMEGHSVYNTRRSAFWQTAKAVLRRLDPDRLDQVNWPSRLVWSNLYKASPKEGWNPSSRMAAVQREACRDLLLHEVKNFRPARIVFATGGDWAKPVLHPEVFKIEGGSDPVSFGRIELDGQLAGRFVIAPHPMGKNQSKWVSAVTQALGSAQQLEAITSP